MIRKRRDGLGGIRTRYFEHVPQKWLYGNTNIISSSRELYRQSLKHSSALASPGQTPFGEQTKAVAVVPKEEVRRT